MNTGHGHVNPREYGVKARCGGPAMCSFCANEFGLQRMQESNAANNLVDQLTQGMQTASAIDWQRKHIRDLSVMRSQDILREKGRQLSFDDLIAEIYATALMDKFNLSDKP